MDPLPIDGAWREICCSRANLKLSRPIPELENTVRIWTGNPYDEPKIEKKYFQSSRDYLTKTTNIYFI